MRIRPFWLALCAFVLLLSRTPSSAQESSIAKHYADVVYGHKLGVALTMDISVPKKPTGIGVVWMVSGGWVSNHESIRPDLAEAFAKHGMTVFQVVHGSQPKFQLREIVQDIHRAVRFIRTNAKQYETDPDRLGISGGSAGGHLSLFMAAYGKDGDPNAKDSVDRASSKIQAVACFFPPTDFLNYAKAGQSAMEIPTLRSYWHVFGVNDQTSKEDREKLAKELSPIYGFDEKTCPIMLIHGDADFLVPIQQSEIVIEKLKGLKVPCALEVRKGKAHGWAGIEKDLELFAGWFEKYLSKK